MKICSICGKLKNISDFRRQNTAKNGITSACKECLNKKQRGIYREKHPLQENEEGYKRCNQCNQIKKFEEFTKNKFGRYGLRSWCKDCVSQKRKVKKRQKYLTHKIKHCKKCNQDKDECDFNFKDKRIELLDWCRDCFDKYDKEYKQGKIECYPNYECGCGHCDRKIDISPIHKYNGIPKFKFGHYSITQKTYKPEKTIDKRRSGI
jgi:hypothetical protein